MQAFVRLVSGRKPLDRDTAECLRQRPTSEGNKRQLRVCLFWTVWTLLREACVSTQAVLGVPRKAPEVDGGETQRKLSPKGQTFVSDCTLQRSSTAPETARTVVGRTEGLVDVRDSAAASGWGHLHAVYYYRIRRTTGDYTRRRIRRGRTRVPRTVPTRLWRTS